MVKASDMSAIQQKIANLTQDVTYFERCIEVAKQHIATLQQALIALNSEPFSLVTKQRGEKSKSYTYSPNEFIAKVFKRFPNQWLSTNEIMIKAFELEGYTLPATFENALKSNNENSFGIGSIVNFEMLSAIV